MKQWQYIVLITFFKLMLVCIAYLATKENVSYAGWFVFLAIIVVVFFGQIPPDDKEM